MHEILKQLISVKKEYLRISKKLFEQAGVQQKVGAWHRQITESMDEQIKKASSETEQRIAEQFNATMLSNFERINVQIKEQLNKLKDSINLVQARQ